MLAMGFSIDFAAAMAQWETARLLAASCAAFAGAPYAALAQRRALAALRGLLAVAAQERARMPLL